MHIDGVEAQWVSVILLVIRKLDKLCVQNADDIVLTKKYLYKALPHRNLNKHRLRNKKTPSLIG